jgi:tetratricopeptide (TPR) repeat protein
VPLPPRGLDPELVQAQAPAPQNMPPVKNGDPGLLPALPAHSDAAAVGKASPLPARKAAEACLTVGESLENGGYEAEAIGQYEKARQENPGLHLERKLAVLYDKVGEPKKALEEFDKALKRAPNDPALLNNLGYCYYNQGKWAEAEQHLRRAVALDPKHQHAAVNLGVTLAQQGRYDESLRVQGKVIGEAEAYSNVAFVLTAQGKREEAKQMYRRALQSNPGFPIARLALDRLENPGKAAVPKKADEGRAARPGREPEGPPPQVEQLPDLSPVHVDPATRRKGAPQ